MIPYCGLANCKEEGYAMVAFIGSNLAAYRCFKHFKELGDFDQKGKLADRRIKRA